MTVILKIYYKKNKEITIYQIYLEVYQMINGSAPLIMDNFFIFRENTHNRRNFQIIFNKNKKNPVRYDSETISEHLSSGQIS